MASSGVPQEEREEVDIDEKFARVLEDEIGEKPPGNARRKQGKTTSSRSAETREELPLLELGSQAGPGEDR